MATPNGTVQLAYEHTPRFENAPTTTPYDVSTAVRYMPAQSFRITPAPAPQNREDEIRGIEGAVPQVLNGYAPAGDVSVRSYANDMIFLLGLCGYQATVTAGAATLDTWTIAQGGTWTGGTFTLTVGAQVTNPIPYNATAAQVQSALGALSTVGVNNVVCSGGPLPGAPVTAIFTGALGGIATTITATATGLTGSTPTVTLTHTATGASGGVQLPDGGYAPSGVNIWTFTKRAGLFPKTAQVTIVYFNEAVYLQGQGFALTQLGGNAAGAITGTLLGLVFGRLQNDPNLTPAYDTQAIPWFREGDARLTWLGGSAVSNDFTWSIANPLEALNTLGVSSFFPDTIFQGPGRVLVTGTVPKRSIAGADIDALISAGTFSSLYTARSPKMIGSGATGTYPYCFFLQEPACQYIGGDIDPLTNARRFGSSFNWFAAYDEAAGYDAKFVITSALAATGVASAGVGL